MGFSMEIAQSIYESTATFNRVILRTSAALGIEDADWKSPYELMPEIEKRNETLHGLLLRFMKAYADWHNMQLEITQKPEIATFENLGKQKQLAANRDEARGTFVAALQKIEKPQT